MFVFIRLSDKTILCGHITNDDEYYLTLENVVEMGTKPLNAIAGLEQQYYFKGMFSPFSISEKIITELPKEMIVTINSDLDTSLEAAYFRFVDDWFLTRNRVNERALKRNDIPDNDKPTSDDNAMDMLEAYLTKQGLANNEIH
jgi:hypothetical protein|tara:strand:- start:730 stop:1158 length:429 start_codon:yes stop_codon:yes gene_type:complete